MIIVGVVHIITIAFHSSYSNAVITLGDEVGNQGIVRYCC